MHPEDYRMLAAMLGGESRIPLMEKEYSLRLAMFHRAGNQGPLGAIGLIDLARGSGFGPPPPKQSTQNVPLEQYPQDGSVRVAVKGSRNGVITELLGVFLGFVAGGSVAVRLDGDPVIREFPRTAIRLAGPDEQPPVARQQKPEPPKLPELPDLSPPAPAAFEGEEDGPSSDPLADTDLAPEPVQPAERYFRPRHERPVRVPGARAPEIILGEEADENVGGVPRPRGFSGDDAFDWSTVKEGSRVWIQDIDKGIIEGNLVSVDEASLTVLLDGQAEPSSHNKALCLLGE